MSPTDERTVDRILDEACGGLVYFERYVPILRRVDPATPWTSADLCAQYDQQRGLDLGLLVGDSNVLRDNVEDARSAADTSDRCAGVVDSSWSGEAARAASADLRSDTALGRSRTESVFDLCCALGEAADTIRASVSDKGIKLAQFDPTIVGASEHSSIGGLTADQVDAVDRLATIDPSRTMTFVQGQADIGLLAGVLPSVVRPEPPVADALPIPSLIPVTPAESSPSQRIEHAKGVCQKWLHDTFVPVVAAACRYLVDVCASTDTAVRDVLSTLAALAEAVDTGDPSGDIPANPAVAAPGSIPVAPAHSPPDPVHLPTAPAHTSTAPVPTAPALVPTAPALVPTAPALVPTAPADADSVGSEGGHRTGQQGVPTASNAPGPRADDPDSQNTDPRLSPRAESPTQSGPGSVLGAMPDCEEVLRAFERAGHELTERMKAVLNDALVAFTESEHDSRTDVPSQAVAPRDTEPDLPAGAEMPPASEPTATPNTASQPTATGNTATGSTATPNADVGTPGPPPQPHGLVDGSVERGHVEAEFDGHSARIALAHNGVVSVEFGTPGGDSRYELRPGPFGLPVVVRTDVQFDPAAVPAAGTPGAAAGQNSGTPGPNISGPDVPPPDVPAPVVPPPDAPGPVVPGPEAFGPAVPPSEDEPAPPQPVEPPAAPAHPAEPAGSGSGAPHDGLNQGPPEASHRGSGARLLEAGPL